MSDRVIDEFYRENFDYVWNTLLRLGVRPADAQDQAQEVFFTVLAQFDDYDRSRPPRPWLFRFAYNFARRYHCDSRVRREVHDELDDRVDSGPQPDEQLLERQRRELVLEALQAIPLARRAVLVGHDIDAHTMPEIAATLGIPVNTAYSRLRLARDAFRSAVARILKQRGGQ